MLNRRKFIQSTATATLAAISLPEIVAAATAHLPAKKFSLNVNDVILFQGDSITDAGRNKSEQKPNVPGMFGAGYAYIAASQLLMNEPDKKLSIYNKGISGNKVFQLADRWDADCLAIKPNVLSILVGVNDYWHTLFGGYKGTIDTYRNDYKALLTRTKQALPDVKLVICEPFAIPGVLVVNEKWFPAFNNYRQVAREIADEFNAAFVPYQSVFDEAMKTTPGSYWTADGVHPNVAGAALMAHAWLKTVK